jgi:pyruvate dehydrogenase E1 component alpha subunit
LRPQEELEAWKKRDPVPAFEAKLLSQKVLTGAQVSDIERGIAARVEEAVQFALASPYPANEDVFEDVYSA